VTDTTAVSEEEFLTPGVPLAIVDVFAKCKERASSQKRSRDPDHAAIQGKGFCPGVGLVIVDAFAEFKEPHSFQKY